MSTRATLRAVSYLGTFGSKLLQLADEFEDDASIISSWLEDGFPDDPESIKTVSDALTGAGAAVIALEQLTARIAEAVRTAVLDETPPLTEVAEA